MKEGQVNPTSRREFKIKPLSRARLIESGFKVDVNVSQHCNVPVVPVHELAGIGVRFRGG